MSRPGAQAIDRGARKFDPGAEHFVNGASAADLGVCQLDPEDRIFDPEASTSDHAAWVLVRGVILRSDTASTAAETPPARLSAMLRHIRLAGQRDGFGRQTLRASYKTTVSSWAYLPPGPRRDPGIHPRRRARLVLVKA